MDVKKDVLGMYVGENESARYWLSILNGLKNRGVEDILIACVDGPYGLPRSNIRRISENRSAAMYYPSDP